MPRSAAGFLKKYEPTKTPVASHPRTCVGDTLMGSWIVDSACACRHSGGGRTHRADFHPDCARSLPVVQYQPVRLDECTDLCRAHSEHLVKDRHQDAEGVIAQYGGPGDSRKMAVLGRRNR